MFLSLPMAATSRLSLILEAGEEWASERSRFRGTLAARFIDVSAPWMWQVLLGYLWTAELLNSRPLEIILEIKKHTHTHTSALTQCTMPRFCQGCWDVRRELYECSLSCQGTVCGLSLTAGTKWWRVCVWRCQGLKITCWTCGQSLKTDLDHSCGSPSHILNLPDNYGWSSLNSRFWLWGERKVASIKPGTQKEYTYTPVLLGQHNSKATPRRQYKKVFGDRWSSNDQCCLAFWHSLAIIFDRMANQNEITNISNVCSFSYQPSFLNPSIPFSSDTDSEVHRPINTLAFQTQLHNTKHCC